MQLRLHRLTLADVPGGDEKASDVRLIAQVVPDHFNRPPSAVGMAQAALGKHRDTRTLRLLVEETARLRRVAGVHTAEGTPTDPLVRRVAQHVLHRLADVPDGSVTVEE